MSPTTNTTEIARRLCLLLAGVRAARVDQLAAIAGYGYTFNAGQEFHAGFGLARRLGWIVPAKAQLSTHGTEFEVVSPGGWECQLA